MAIKMPLPETVTARREAVSVGLPKIHHLFFDGQFVPAAAGRTMQLVDPATELALTEVALADSSDVELAVEAARRAQREWARIDWSERAARLRAFADAVDAAAEQLALLDTICGGFPISGMRHDVSLGARNIRYAAGLCSEAKGTTTPAPGGTFNATIREPFGVVGRLVPYNHPVFLAAHGIAGPVAMGNAIILKPADQTPLSALKLAELAADFFPRGLVSVVTGDGPTTGDAFVRCPGISRIAFTGSVETGRRVAIAAAETFTNVTLELGGKNPGIVLPDANIKAAASQAVRGMNLVRSQGQSCGSPSQLLVHEGVHDQFVKAVVAEVEQLVVGDPLDDSSEVGPLAFAAHYERVCAAIERGKEGGATLVCGGSRTKQFSNGFYVDPAVFTEVDTASELASVELFGPIMSILKYRDLDAAVRLANRLDYGLGAYVWTRDLDTAISLAGQLDVGFVWINGRGQRPPGAPFGGRKHSGQGYENALEELLSYTQLKNVFIGHADDL